MFKVNTDGTGFAVLKNFSGIDGAVYYARLTLSGSVLYGTTQQGGSLGEGTVFKIDLSAPIPMAIQSLGSSVVLSWTNPLFALQAAPAITGSFANIPGATSPYTNPISGMQQFFRLSQ